VALNILQAHAQAVLDLLDGDDVPPALVVLAGENPRDPNTGAPSTPPPYVLVYIGFRVPGADEEPDKVSPELAVSQALYTTAVCHSVGGNQHAALAVAGRVRAALHGVTPTIAGRGCGPIKWADGAFVQRDETTGVLISDLVTEYEFLSLPG
jgi:hypothetical protein